VDLAPQHRIAVVTDHPTTVLQRHCPPQQRGHPAAEPHRAPALGLLDLRTPLQQVGRALALRELQRVIGQEAIADQDALIVVPEDLDDHLVAPASADAIERGVLISEDPEPGRPAADLPAGLIDVLHDAVAGGLDQAVVAGLGQPPQAVAAADQRRRGDHQTGEGQEHRGALAIRGADAVLQVGGEPEQPWPELDGGGPQGVGGRLGVAALDAAEAGRAAGHRDAEAGDDRLGLGQVDLVLVMDGDRGVVQRGAAFRAGGRQRDLDRAIDLLRRWGGSMAGRVPRLAARPLGLGLGRTFGEGGGLALPRPPGLLQLRLESLHLGAQLVDLAGLPPGQVEEFVVGGCLVIHDVGFTRSRAPNATGERSD
jgi:hypothetical protein